MHGHFQHSGNVVICHFPLISISKLIIHFLLQQMIITIMYIAAPWYPTVVYVACTQEGADWYSSIKSELMEAPVSPC